jgi:hypothetical protein
VLFLEDLEDTGARLKDVMQACTEETSSWSGRSLSPRWPGSAFDSPRSMPSKMEQRPTVWSISTCPSPVWWRCAELL